MSATDPSSAHRLPPSLVHHVECVCDRFEAAWRAPAAAGPRPQIEDYLGGVDISSDPRVHQEQFDFAFV